MMNVVIRKETEQDIYQVNNLIRDAFWNLFEPGCTEHYLAHVIRKSDDYINDFSLLACIDNQVVGVIMYTRSTIVQSNKTIPVLTFGPLAVDPLWQKQGIGAKLIEHSMALAEAKGEKAIIIYGHSTYYPRFGFIPCSSANIVNEKGMVIDAFMIRPLGQTNVSSLAGTFYESPVFELVKDQDAVEQFDHGFPPKEKGTPKWNLHE